LPGATLARQLSSVNTFLVAYDKVFWLLRIAFFAAAAVAVVVCALDWGVRTRRINPFGPLARFLRQTVDPLIAPVERRVVRAGGVPATAPWWALATIVIGGIVILSLLGFVRGQVLLVASALQTGGRGIYVLLVTWVFAILQIALIVRVISSWIRISPYSPWIRWTFTITEPILRPLRQVVPSIGMIDITPIVAYFLLRLLQWALLNLG
jgi:YggT family protein